MAYSEEELAINKKTDMKQNVTLMKKFYQL